MDLKYMLFKKPGGKKNEKKEKGDKVHSIHMGLGEKGNKENKRLSIPTSPIIISVCVRETRCYCI